MGLERGKRQDAGSPPSDIDGGGSNERRKIKGFAHSAADDCGGK